MQAVVSPSILEGIRREMALPEEQLSAIASKNAQKFILNRRKTDVLLK